MRSKIEAPGEVAQKTVEDRWFERLLRKINSNIVPDVDWPLNILTSRSLIEKITVCLEKLLVLSRELWRVLSLQLKQKPDEDLKRPTVRGVSLEQVELPRASLKLESCWCNSQVADLGSNLGSVSYDNHSR